MSLNRDITGDCPIVQTSDNKQLILPYWIADRVSVAQQIEEHGAGSSTSLTGAIRLDPDNIIDVRAYLTCSKDRMMPVITDIESKPELRIDDDRRVKFHTKTALEHHKLDTSLGGPLTSLKVSLPSPLLPAFINAGITVRPWQDTEQAAIPGLIYPAPTTAPA